MLCFSTFQSLHHVSIIAKCDLLHYYCSLFCTGQEMDHFDMKVHLYTHSGRSGYMDEFSVNQSSKNKK